MIIKRNEIYAGILKTKDNGIKTKDIRKVIFRKINKTAIDLLYEAEYPIKFILNKNKYIDSRTIIKIDKVLEEIGYDDILTDKDINKILNFDFQEVVIRSKIYFKQINEEAYPYYFDNKWILRERPGFISQEDIKKRVYTI